MLVLLSIDYKVKILQDPDLTICTYQIINEGGYGTVGIQLFGKQVFFNIRVEYRC